MNYKPCAAEKKCATLSDIFYTINKAQHFEFPHANCDMYEKEMLAALYFKQSGFGTFCCGIIASFTGIVCNIEHLKQNSQFVNYVTAWMRLKFIAEQVDPIRYRHYFERLSIPANKVPKLPTELLELYKADSTEFYVSVDNLANTIQMKWIEIMVNGAAATEADLDILCNRINDQLPKVRASISTAAKTTFDPYEFPIRPFLEYQRELRRIIM